MLINILITMIVQLIDVTVVTSAAFHVHNTFESCLMWPASHSMAFYMTL